MFFLVKLLKKSKNLSAFACRLTQLTGKSNYPIHPKHLINTGDPWYLDGIKSGDLVLDLGCGNGQHSINIASQCKQVTAVDFDSKQLQIGASLARDKGIKNIAFKKADLEKKLSFPKNSFDKILALDIIEHLNNRQQFLREIKRVLKPRGIVYVTMPNQNTSWKKMQVRAGLNCYSDPDHKIEYSLTSAKKEVARSGLKIISIRPIVYDTPWVGFIDCLGGVSLSLYQKLSQWKIDKAKQSPQESIGWRLKVKY